MAFSITTATSSRASNSDADSVTLPASVSAGDLCLAFHVSDSTLTRTFPSPWVEILDQATSNHNIGIAYLIASGGETAVSVTKSGTERFSAIAMRITAATWHGTTAPEVAAFATGTSNVPNPSAVNASWGSEANLFIAVGVWDSSDGAVTVSAYPTNYSSNNTASPVISSSGLCALGTFETTAASDDPGTFTISASDEWMGGTVVVRPAGGAPPAFSPPHNLMTLGVGR